MPTRRAACALLTLVACKPPPVNLCPNLEVAAEIAENDEDPGPHAWFGGMVSTLDTGTMLPPAEIRDCRERRVESPQNTCDALPFAGKRRPDRPLTSDDIVNTRRSGDEFLLWTQVHHFDDGSALGPVALARWVPRGIRVSALGSLHAAAKQARLRLEPLGDGLVLITEGSACTTSDDCVPVTRVIPLVEGNFVDQAMRNPAGGCEGAATFPLVARVDVALDPTRTRQFRLQRNIVIKDGVGVIHEEAIATDIDTGQTDVPGVEFRRQSKARELLLDKDTLVIDHGIWDDFIAQDGSVRPSDYVTPPTTPGTAAPAAAAPPISAPPAGPTPAPRRR